MSACLHCGAAPQTGSPARESLHQSSVTNDIYQNENRSRLTFLTTRDARERPITESFRRRAPQCMTVEHAGVPIRDLFALSDGEVRQLQLEARNKRALDAAKKLELVERSKPKPPPGPPPPTKKPPPPPGPPPGVYPFAPRPPEIPAGTRFVSTPREAFGGVEEEKGGSAVQQLRARLQSPRRGPRGPPPRGPPPPERGARGPQLV
jgi:hypothetical protein